MALRIELLALILPFICPFLSSFLCFCIETVENVCDSFLYNLFIASYI